MQFTATFIVLACALLQVANGVPTPNVDEQVLERKGEPFSSSAFGAPSDYTLTVLGMKMPQADGHFVHIEVGSYDVSEGTEVEKRYTYGGYLVLKTDGRTHEGDMDLDKRWAASYDVEGKSESELNDDGDLNNEPALEKRACDWYHLTNEEESDGIAALNAPCPPAA
ncbi:hypothetical protein FOMPIDRAFT_1019367 [Fomitopsis schrenkii]|uniref:Uncharacterized protein n=1 Tax=Fomitopsis schrenkii TaxID=2126942 RepID=S8DWQ9_FOMSC|nr:hypothetical protein FOMPIDRAFT_1019367 [Fomitopsis schrenkii]